MDFEDLTIADLRRLFAALVALGGDDMVKKLIERVPAERELHGRVTIGTLFRLLEQTAGRTVLPEEIAALLKALSHPEKNDQEILAAVARLVEGADSAEEMPEPYDDDFDTGIVEEADDVWLNNTPEEIVEPPPFADPEVLDEGPDSIFETLESEPDTEPEIDDEAFFREMTEPEPLPEPPLADTPENQRRERIEQLHYRLFGKHAPETNPPATTAQRLAVVADRLRTQTALRSSLIQLTSISTVVTVDRGQSMSHRVSAANCIASTDLNVNNYLRHHRIKVVDRLRGSTTEQCQVVTLSREASVSAIDRELKLLGYRHATFDELVAFAATRPVLKQPPSASFSGFPVGVIAIGTKLSDGQYVPCLRASKHRDEFDLTTHFSADMYYPGIQFLVVKKS